ncbi:MAG TPA: FAD-dependent monooxygenase [Gammaproteobacteria bacterium]
MMHHRFQSEEMLDVLVVGAGPTGLALAAQLCAFGARFRLVDKSLDRAQESRALAVQARTLELLESLGLGAKLVSRGNPSARVLLHFGQERPAEVRLGDFGAEDTRFPFVLFVPQTETEAVLGEYLDAHDIPIEREVELTALRQSANGVDCRLRRRDGREEAVTARYVVGCDGAHSTVRKLVGVPFQGEAYLQDFLLGDVEVEGALEPDALHAFAAGPQGVALFFPLRVPATWRIITFAEATAESGRRPVHAAEALKMNSLPLEELQAAVDGATGGGLRVHSPAWLTHFKLHHRQARHYRVDRVFLAGDAAHIHSPVGGQGMNTGIQDAWNLGWKLAFVCRRLAEKTLLDSYEAERWPVGRFLLRTTDRAFGVLVRLMSAGRAARWVRRNVVARVLPRVMQSERWRAKAFRFVAELDIHYRGSPAVAEGEPPAHSALRPGERLPDARVTCDGREIWLQQEVVGAHLAVLLCGDRGSWDAAQVEALRDAAGHVVVRHLVHVPSPGDLVAPTGRLLARFGVVDETDSAQYVVRPDGYIAYRSAGSDLRLLRERLLTG